MLTEIDTDAGALFRRELHEVERQHGRIDGEEKNVQARTRFRKFWDALEQIAAEAPPFGPKPGVEYELRDPDPHTGEIGGEIIAHRLDRVAPLLLPFCIVGDRIEILDRSFDAADLDPAIAALVHRLAEYYGDS
jgi:hypothetical protein